MSSRIHSLAVIEAGAAIGEGCDVGPFCHVGPQVHLGSGTRLHSHVVVDGNTTVGENCEIFSFACIGKRTQDLKYKGGKAYVEIGARTTLREYVTVHASTLDGGKTVIGNDCNILAYCHLAHDCVLGERVIMSNNTQLAGHVIIEDRVVFGGMVGVVQFVHIGRLAMIGATAKVVQDIAPYVLADGSPALPVTINKIGLERNNFTPEQIRTLAQVFKLFFRSNLRAEEAVTRLRAEFPDVPEVAHFIAFVQASQRGIARPKTDQ